MTKLCKRIGEDKDFADMLSWLQDHAYSDMVIYTTLVLSNIIAVCCKKKIKIIDHQQKHFIFILEAQVE